MPLALVAERREQSGRSTKFAVKCRAARAAPLSLATLLHAKVSAIGGAPFILPGHRIHCLRTASTVNSLAIKAPHCYKLASARTPKNQSYGYERFGTSGIPRTPQETKENRIK
jgi:hypothetical protein